MAEEPRTIEGIIFPWVETGTEGVVWSLQESKYISEDGKRWDYSGLNPLQDGDCLTVFNDDGSVRWEGTIKLEYERNYEPYPMNPQYGQQAVNGWWVRGLQEGVDPEEWFRMFHDQPRAVLRR